MMANADLPELDDDYEGRGPGDESGDGYQFHDYKLNSKDSFAKSMGMSDIVSYGPNKSGSKNFAAQQKKPYKKIEEMDDEDRYLDDIINRNYNGKAPPAIN